MFTGSGVLQEAVAIFRTEKETTKRYDFTHYTIFITHS